MRRFTLIEMLVVVAITAVLVSLLAPALHRAVQSATTLSCANNLHQQGLGFAIYLEDFRRFPAPVWFRDGDGSHVSRTRVGGDKSRFHPFAGETFYRWQMAVAFAAGLTADSATYNRSYKNLNIFGCPGVDPVRQGQLSHYGINNSVTWTSPESHWPDGRVGRPPERPMVLVTDSCNNVDDGARLEFAKIERLGAANGYDWRHSNTAINVLFTAGNVRTCGIATRPLRAETATVRYLNGSTASRDHDIAWWQPAYRITD